MNKHKELEWNGERLVTNINTIGATEHLHRYALACEFVKDKIVLDIASGEGYGSNLMAKNAKKVIGVDISEEAISHASNKYKSDNLFFKTGNVTSIPINNDSIDVVVSFETIEHIYEQEIMLNEIKRVMKPNGMLVISTPEKSSYEDVNKEKNRFHVKELYFNEFEQLISSNFSNYCFLFQKSVYGSLIIPQCNNNNKYIEYWGDYENLNLSNNICNPIFNICIASDQEISKQNVSFFNSFKDYDKILQDFQCQIIDIRKSKNYKTGKIILYPFRKIKRWIK